MEHGQEDSFSKAGVHSDEYLNLSRIEQAERPARDLIQPPTGRQQPPAVNRPAFEWSVPQSPSMYVQQTPIQPQAMNMMMQQMLRQCPSLRSNPMMSMMMAQMQLMQQQMMSSSAGRFPVQDVPPGDVRAPVMDPASRQPQPPVRSKPPQFETFNAHDYSKTSDKQEAPPYEPTMAEQPRPKKVSVRNNNPTYDYRDAPSQVQESKARSMQVTTDEVLQRQSSSGLGFHTEDYTSIPTSSTESRQQPMIEPSSTRSARKVRAEDDFHAQQPLPAQLKEQPPPFVAKKPISFDDMPIRPMKNPNMYASEEPIKQFVPKAKPAPIPFDEMPIGGKNSMSLGGLEEKSPPLTYEQLKPSKPQFNRNSEVHQPNPYRQIEERPVKGLALSLEEVLQQKIGKEPKQSEQAENGAPSEPRISNFLKKGTRQFLSSAKNRTVGLSQSREEPAQAKAPPKKIAKQPPMNTSSLRQEDSFKVQPSANKFKQPPKVKAEQTEYREKSPAAPKRKIIDTEEHPLERSEPRRDKAISKHVPNKPKKDYTNIFEDEHSEPEEEVVEVLPGIKLPKWQIAELKEHFALETQSVKMEEQRLQKLRNKYEQMLRVLEQEKEQNAQKLQQEREEFEDFKREEMKAIKNERRVAERQKQAVCSTTNKKEKEELEAAKKEWEKEKEDFKKRENSSRILIEKQKREIEQLKRQCASATEPSKKHHTKGSDLDVSVEKDTENVRETRKPNTILKKPVVARQQRSESRDQTASNKPLHKSILNTEGRYSEQKQLEGKRANQPRQEAARLKESDKLKTSSSAFQSVTNNSSVSSKMPDYEDLKTDRAKQQSNAGPGTKAMNKNVPSTLEQRHKPVYEEDKRSAWDMQNRSRSNRSRSNRSRSSSEESFDCYHESMEVSDLNNLRNLSVRMVTPQMIEDLLHYYNTKEYQRLQKLASTKPRKLVSEQDGGDKTIKTYADGVRETIFRTGIRKEVLDGYTIIHFKNKDIKQKLEDGTTLYYFSEKEVDQITLLNRVNVPLQLAQIFRFDNDQVEFHFPDGRIEIRHADGSIKIQHKD